MILSINPCHDSSAVWLDESGEVTHAISEERLTREKHHFIFPRKSLAWLDKEVSLSKTRTVVVAGISQFEFFTPQMVNWIFREDSGAGFDGMREYRFPPGMLKVENLETKRLFLEYLKLELEKWNISADLIFANHHECHAWSAIVPSGYEKGLALTLDGEGDGESGSLWKFARTETGFDVRKLKSIAVKNSLGYFYSAIAARYNLKRYSHEGKITGLAAYGEEGPSLDYLKRKITCSNGAPFIKIPKSKFLKGLFFAINKVGLSSDYPYSHTAIVEEAADRSLSFAELAHSGQKVLEAVALEMLEQISSEFGRQNLVLSGGVFANVKLNQVIAESDFVNRVFVYPNMGDGGLPVGGAYKQLSDQKGIFINSQISFNPYIGTRMDSIDSVMKQDPRLFVDDTTEDDWIDRIVDLLNNDYCLGLIQGRMEFGPRALMNRSIVASATDSSINNHLNKRLRRTEYMPFAPVVRIEDFSRVFIVDKIKDLRVFDSMTMTCGVRREFVDKIPAIVHIDGSARPQVVTKENNIIAWKILRRYQEVTGLPCLINTSFNAHEEPIVESPQDVVNSIISNVIDFVVYPYSIVKRKY